jgi:repressor LexA
MPSSELEQQFSKGWHLRSLSERQQRIIDFIRRFRDENHYPPTVRDIVNGCRVSSTSVVDYNLRLLEKRNIIRRHAGISRGIELLDEIESNAMPKVPLVGLIAAGAPIPVPSADAWDTVSSAETVEVPEDLTRNRTGVYALQVKGTSMIDALINDGDIVVLQYTNSVENGETAAVWLKAEKEATLKKFYREKNRVRLEPANITMKPIYAAADNVEVQGRVIGVIRKLG